MKYHYLFHFTIPSQECFYIILDVVLFSGVPPLGALHKTMFDCQCLVSTCRICPCWLLVISYHQYPCVSRVCPIRISVLLEESLNLFLLQIEIMIRHEIPILLLERLINLKSVFSNKKTNDKHCIDSRRPRTKSKFYVGKSLIFLG